MTILPNIEEAMEDARNGKLSPYWQNNLKRECLHLSRRSLAYSSSALHAGQSASPLVQCTPQQYRRTMRVTVSVSVSFSLFKF